ncbi:hypothetical protein [Oscillibacter valericigenes]|uniref:hypothetical protein n=1 Tax=Oscillibacter valericigenes TaxID=351091 RepID=UPI00195B622D|nr:hypothetical protein [Oscillibacter valericigenes]MBM6909800.1 hypothetical protein [Oscillibacter valericigenes]
MKNRVVLLSLTIAGLFCWILMFLLNASSRDTSGISYLLSVAGAALFGTGVGSLLQLERLSRNPAYRQRQKAQFDERNQAIRDRAGCIAGFLTVGLLVVSGLVFLGLEWFGIPDWVGWVFIGIYLFYILAFLGLCKWLQRKM